MTILNITPDSFFEGSRTADVDSIACRVREAIAQGATIIDVGGYSSRPGADDIPIEEEWRRVDLGIGVVRSISQDIIISVDTFRGEVVRRAASKYGYLVVNDIQAGEADESMLRVVAEYKLPYIAMHMRGTPQSMQSMTEYHDVVEDVLEYFRTKVTQLQTMGIEQIILDPGFGFAKSVEQNYELLAALPRLAALGCPLLVGVSRKSMIYKVLGCSAEDALAGTIALGWEALRGGASILRVHDTQEAVDTLRLYEKFENVNM